MEQQLAAGAGERQVAELVEDDDVEAGELRRERAGPFDFAQDMLAEAGFLLRRFTRSTVLK